MCGPARFDALDLNPALIRRDATVPLDQVGNFLVLETPHAADLSRRLKAEGVWTDYRGTALRLGPAPYLCDGQLVEAMTRLGRVCRGLFLLGGTSPLWGADPPRTTTHHK